MSIEKRPNVISDVISALEEGQLIPSIHAQEQMSKRDIQMSDIEEAVVTAIDKYKKED